MWSLKIINAFLQKTKYLTWKMQYYFYSTFLLKLNTQSTSYCRCHSYSAFISAQEHFPNIHTLIAVPGK